MASRVKQKSCANWRNMSSVYRGLEAEVVYAKGLEAAKSIDYRRVVQLTYDSLGTIALLRRNVDDAHSYFLRSLKITFESGQTRE